MLVKTLLNSIEKYPSFVYGKISLKQVDDDKSLVINLSPRKGSQGKCKECGKPCPTYDRQPKRFYQHVPFWDIPVYFCYRPRRVTCKTHGIHVEAVPWAKGKERTTKSFQLFLARWAKRLSWRETAQSFKTSWDTVYRAVKWVVDYGLAHRDWDNVEQIGIDEIAVYKGQNYLTCIYQIEPGIRRLLWCGEGRSVKTLLRFFRVFGKERAERLKFVCSDMWAPFLKVIKKKCINAYNILDRFHIAKKLNEAVDEVRREEVKKIKAEKQDNVLTHGRWLLLKRPAHLTKKQTSRLSELLKINLMSIKAYLMKEDFQRFWAYKSKAWAGKFLEDWATRAMQSSLAPMKKVAKMLRNHKKLILNWFEAEGRLSSGPVEGLNNKAKLAIRKAYGFKSTDCLKIALYHQLGDLKEPPDTHRYC